MPAKSLPCARNELLAVGPQRLYTGRNLDHIAFPLGGIGAGSVSLGGWGQLRDWEIRNHPAKGTTIPNAFFAVRVKDGKKPPRVKTLQGPAGGNVIGGGHSAPTAAGEGLPHFRECAFRGEYPIAQIVLADEDFPITAKLTAFNPFISLNDRDSGLPVAVMMYEITNIGKKKIEVSVLGNLTNTVNGERVAVRLANLDLGDTRLNKRVRQMVATMAERQIRSQRPSSPATEAMPRVAPYSERANVAAVTFLMRPAHPCPMEDANQTMGQRVRPRHAPP